MSFFSNLLTGGATNLIDAVGNAINKNVTSDEERISLENEIQKAEIEYKVEMRSLDVKEAGLYLAGIDSARDNQTQIQESENASWLSKNTQYILAFLVILLCMGMFAKALFGGLGDNPVVMMILGGLLGYNGQVISYFFGASRDSGEHTKKMSAIINGNGNK